MKYLFIVLGIFSLFFGIIGLFLPLLPTTPFLLLSAFLFCRSSKKLHNWLHNNRIFGKYLKSYSEGRGISLKLKIFVLTLLYGTILYSVFFVVENSLIKILLIGIAVGVSVHIFAIKTNKNC
ncbi:MAG TPA: DUF454 domain-containing protein [Bacteroidales bacterium]|nr:MAG: hypothetical protein A2W98_05095 [Bacteroidetes bacterium GWF2_33_38]OFY75093.1 MAG: hypothetical protein A2265_04725 [Bacteroidetes bacterium RIFOXYA12_FULL_33_9]OFY90410.1 MAG: hypothetical protein A2236_01620 [Bacteroidetes bacterium RIFOXYA2_FULL_33_7]HBF88270.1 DUF454 domain-containing protein [Bacteroidales bacterium]